MKIVTVLLLIENACRRLRRRLGHGRDGSAEFLYASGLLFEINRRVLHPLGMALAVECDNDDNVVGFGGLQRPEAGKETGMWYESTTLASASAKLAKWRFDNEATDLEQRRLESRCWIEQPLPHEHQITYMYAKMRMGP